MCTVVKQNDLYVASYSCLFDHIFTIYVSGVQWYDSLVYSRGYHLVSQN